MLLDGKFRLSELVPAAKAVAVSVPVQLKPSGVDSGGVVGSVGRITTQLEPSFRDLFTDTPLRN